VKSDDKIKRDFTAERPLEKAVTDITEILREKHRQLQGIPFINSKHLICPSKKASCVNA